MRGFRAVAYNGLGAMKLNPDTEGLGGNSKLYLNRSQPGEL